MQLNLLTAIEEHYEKLSKTQKRMADFIRQNVHQIPFLSIKELGDKSEVSPASITRFTRELGFSGYADFQKSAAELIRRDVVPMRELKGAITSRDNDNVLKKTTEQNIDNLKSLYTEELYQNFAGAVEIAAASRKIYICASRSSYCVGYYLYFMLKGFMENVELLAEGTSDISNKLQYVTNEDCVIAVSYERYTRSTFNMVSYFEKEGCGIIAITDSYHSPIAMKADKVLLAKHAPDTYSFVTSMTIANSLVTAIGRVDADKTLRNLERQDRIALDYNLYL